MVGALLLAAALSQAPEAHAAPEPAPSRGVLLEDLTCVEAETRLKAFVASQ